MRSIGILKCTLPSVFAMIFVFMTPSNAGADENRITENSILKFTAGITTAFLIHEASHALVAELTNTELDWEMGNYNQPLAFTEYGTSDSKGLALYSAGLVSQVIGSEIILRKDGINKNSAFVRGMMAWNIVNPILYALDYWFIRRSNEEEGDFHQGDLEGIEYYSNDATANGFALTLAGIAAYQGYRFLKTQSWAPDWIKRESHHLSYGPFPSKGMGVLFEIRF